MTEVAPAAPAAPAAAPAPASPAAPAGQWYESPDYAFDPEDRQFYASKNYPDPKTALKSLRHADTMARSRNVIEKPDPAKVKDWNGFTELGWTPDRTKYAVNKPALKTGETLDEGAFNSFLDIAHAAKIPPFQAEQIANAMHALDIQARNDAAAQGAEAKRALDQKLRGEWGIDYDAKMTRAQRAFAFLGGEDFKPDEIMAAIGGSPRTAKLFAKIGEMIGEDNMPAPGAGGAFGGQTPGAARAERLKLENDKAWMAVFNDPRHPQHKDYVAQRQGLMDIEAKGNRAA